MLKALFTSATGMRAQQLVVDNTANNLANVNTTGFKQSKVEFQDLIYVTTQAAGTEATAGVQVPTGFQIGSGVRPAATTKLFSQGVLELTGNPVDMAIEGQGFLQIDLPTGEPRYTRDGSFHLSANGDIVNSDGLPLAPGISIPSDALEISIGTDGTVSVITPGSTTPTSLGQITMVRFPNPAGLSSEGSNLFAETAASGSPNSGIAGQDGFGALRQGFLERSNVEVVSELVNLILAQRAYEFNSRAIRAGDEMLAVTNNLTR